jgi:hypothetical protein
MFYESKIKNVIVWNFLNKFEVHTLPVLTAFALRRTHALNIKF